MEFKADIKKGVCKAVIAGELTIYHAGEFRKKLEKAIKKANTLNLDLAGVSEIDTSCFQLLMQAQAACQDYDKPFNLLAISPAISEVMEMFGMQRHFAEPARLAAD